MYLLYRESKILILRYGIGIMNESFAKKLCYPIDKSDLDMKIFANQVDGEIIEALLTCTSCRRYYPVIYGIPIMTPDEYRDKAIEGATLKKWGLHLDGSKEGTFLLGELQEEGGE